MHACTHVTSLFATARPSQRHDGSSSRVRQGLESATGSKLPWGAEAESYALTVPVHGPPLVKPIGRVHVACVGVDHHTVRGVDARAMDDERVVEDDVAFFEVGHEPLAILPLV
jgi:hypothetical protein